MLVVAQDLHRVAGRGVRWFVVGRSGECSCMNRTTVSKLYGRVGNKAKVPASSRSTVIFNTIVIVRVGCEEV